MDVVNLAALAGAVRRRASGGALDRIEAALAVSDELTTGADELIGQFVAEARATGYSWTEIGQRIGVSKQAARQRFVRRETDSASPAPPPPARRRRGRGKPGGGRCSFCGKPEAPRLRLIAGPGVYICSECIGLCNEILAEGTATS